MIGGEGGIDELTRGITAAKRIDYGCIRWNVRSVRCLFGLNYQHIRGESLGKLENRVCGK